MVVLIRLAAKYGILVIEFANEKREAGFPLLEATTEGSRLPFRPVMMTSACFTWSCRGRLATAPP